MATVAREGIRQSSWGLQRYRRRLHRVYGPSTPTRLGCWNHAVRLSKTWPVAWPRNYSQRISSIRTNFGLRKSWKWTRSSCSAVLRALSTDGKDQMLHPLTAQGRILCACMRIRSWKPEKSRGIDCWKCEIPGVRVNGEVPGATAQNSGTYSRSSCLLSQPYIES